MLGFRLVFIVGFGLALVGACSSDDGDDGGSGQSIASLCAAGCEKTTPLNCANDPSDCAGACEAEANQAGNCSSQFQAFLSCGANRPASDFECDADGESTLKAGVCSAEGGALAQCIFGSIGVGDGGASDCPFTNDGECDEPDLCPAGTDTADCVGAAADGG